MTRHQGGKLLQLTSSIAFVPLLAAIFYRSSFSRLRVSSFDSTSRRRFCKSDSSIAPTWLSIQKPCHLWVRQLHLSRQLLALVRSTQTHLDPDDESCPLCNASSTNSGSCSLVLTSSQTSSSNASERMRRCEQRSSLRKRLCTRWQT